jgi:hypothetical protein
MKMFKRVTNYAFLMSIYVAGILIGGIYTPDVMKYARQFNAVENTNQQERMQQKPQKKKQRNYRSTGLV